MNYAFIKNQEVVNIVIFDSFNEDLFNIFKLDFNLDNIVLEEKNCVIGGTYDGTKFWLPQPYPSWIKNEELNEWEAPVPYPIIEDGSDEQYIWDENTISWLLLPPSN